MGQQRPKSSETQPKNEQQCLLDLGEELNETAANPNNDQVDSTRDAVPQGSSTNPFIADDTFTQLANRPTTNNGMLPTHHHHFTTLDDSGEFAVPASSANSEDVNKSFQFPLTGAFAEMVNNLKDKPLPEPVEVITLQNQSSSGSIEMLEKNKLNPFLDHNHQSNPGSIDLNIGGAGAQANASTASATNIFSNGVADRGEAEDKECSQPLIPSTSEPKILNQLISSSEQELPTTQNKQKNKFVVIQKCDTKNISDTPTFYENTNLLSIFCTV